MSGRGDQVRGVEGEEVRDELVLRDAQLPAIMGVEGASCEVVQAPLSRDVAHARDRATVPRGDCLVIELKEDIDVVGNESQ